MSFSVSTRGFNADVCVICRMLEVCTLRLSDTCTNVPSAELNLPYYPLLRRNVDCVIALDASADSQVITVAMSGTIYADPNCHPRICGSLERKVCASMLSHHNRTR